MVIQASYNFSSLLNIVGLNTKSEDGFTLIELLTVIGIVGVLSSLGLTSFTYYKSSAAITVAESTVHDARNAFEAGTVDLDDPPASVALVQQNSQGSVSNAAANTLLPGFRVPKNLMFRVSYDNTCFTPDCQVVMVEARHCQGEEYIRWQRFGDGVELKLAIAGSGCS